MDRDVEARFAGVEAGIGFMVLLVVWTFGALGALGVVALCFTGQIPAEPGNLATVALGLVVVGWFGTRLWRDFHLIRVVEITEGDDWILRSVFGIVRGRLAPNKPREVLIKEQDVWSFIGIPRKFRFGWAEIRAEGHVWKTCRNPPDAQHKGVAVLRSWIRAHSS